MTQHCTLKVKAMFFQVTEHLFDPHSSSVISQGHTSIGQIGGQAPGLFFASLPMHQQVDRVDLLGGQTASSQPDTLTRPVDVTTEGLPTTLFVEPDPSIGFLAQNIEPMPAIQLAQDRHSAEFAVSDQKNSRSNRDRLTHIGQQSQLLGSRAVSSDVFDPGPGNRDGSFSVCQANDQQLMTKANLGAIDDQPNFSHVPELCSQPLPGDGLVPFSYADGRVVQKSAQPSGSAQQLGWAGYLPCNAAQMHRPALIDPDDQPDEIADLGD